MNTNSSLETWRLAKEAARRPLRSPRRVFFLGAFCLAALLSLPAGELQAQPPRAGRSVSPIGEDDAGRQPDSDAIRRHFFPPQLVVRMQEEIALTAEQRKTLIAEMQSAQSDLVPLQFDAQEAQDALGRMIQGDRMDEEAVLQQARKVMDLEARVRARHLALLVRIKNLLTPEQQNRLREVQRRLWTRRNFRR